MSAAGSNGKKTGRDRLCLFEIRTPSLGKGDVGRSAGGASGSSRVGGHRLLFGEERRLRGSTGPWIAQMSLSSQTRKRPGRSGHRRTMREDVDVDRRRPAILGKSGLFERLADVAGEIEPSERSGERSCVLMVGWLFATKSPASGPRRGPNRRWRALQERGFVC